MEKITSMLELRNAIQVLEIKKAKEEILLKEQFIRSFENIKPANLIKSTWKELSTSPDFKGELLNTSLGLVTGYISKKAVVGTSHNPLKKLLGTLLQVGVTSLVSKNANGLKSATVYLIKNILGNKKNKNNIT